MFDFFLQNHQEITRFGRDQRCCGKIDKEYHEKLKKVLECWPNMEYKIKDCSHVSYVMCIALQN
jgi:hypothetical protein